MNVLVGHGIVENRCSLTSEVSKVENKIWPFLGFRQERLNLASIPREDVMDEVLEN